jgi:GNAT superfamily N-acetyltransferase
MSVDVTTAVETHPLTPDRWHDFADLMNSRFDLRRCWCMAQRRPESYTRYTSDANRRAMKKAVDTAAAPPGVLAYVEGAPVGWCAIAPRLEFQQLAKKRATAPIDDQPVWSIVCFMVRRPLRRRGISRALLAAALALASQHGAEIVEAYPIEGIRNSYRGFPSVFKDAGFQEVARDPHDRLIMRYRIPRRHTNRRKR